MTPPPTRIPANPELFNVKASRKISVSLDTKHTSTVLVPIESKAGYCSRIFGGEEYLVAFSNTVLVRKPIHIPSLLPRNHSKIPAKHHRL